MPYILLAIAALIGLYGLYRFFMVANIRQIAALFMVLTMLAICGALVFMAVTGRLPAALGLLAALWPFIMAYWQHRKRKGGGHAGLATTADSRAGMTRAEALDILGLDEQADIEQIQAAYKRLMKKVHPDQEGSKGLASRLNEAHTVLTDDPDTGL